MRFDGRDLMDLDERAMQEVRGAGIALIFQEPMTALNPVFTIGNQIEETLQRARRRARPGGAAARDRAARGGQHARIRSSACATIRTSSPAACASAR